MEDLGLPVEFSGRQDLNSDFEAKFNLDSNSTTPPSGENSAPESAKTSSPYGDHRAAEDASAADAQIAIADFGFVSKYVFPFTKQVRVDVRAMFPIDKETYDKADSMEKKVAWLYGVLRLLTLILYFLFLAIFTATASEYLTGTKRLDWLPDFIFAIDVANPTLKAIITIVLAGAVLAGVRFFLRWQFLREIERLSENFAHEVSQLYSDVTTRAFEMANSVRDRITDGCTWVESAELFAKASLWNAKRAEFLDRYSSNIAWKNRWMFLRIEFAAFLIKTVATLALVAVILFGFQFDPAGVSSDIGKKIAPVVFLLLNLHFGWGYAFRKQGDFWTRAFSKETKLQGSVETTYYNTIPRVIANLVDQVQAMERSKSN